METENVRKYRQVVSDLMVTTRRLTEAHDALTVAEDRKLKTGGGIESHLRSAALRIAQVSEGVELR